MYTVFLIGNMASGKSTAARYLERRGARRIDLDVWAKSLYQPGSDVVSELVEAFGYEILDEEGGVRLPVLADRAFSSLEDTEVLNGIVHPRLLERLSNMLVPPVCCVASVPACDLLVVEVSAPRGFETAFGLADDVLAVIAPEELRRSRALARGVSADDFDRRAAVQPTDDELRGWASIVIENSGTQDELAKRLDAWLADLGLLGAAPDGPVSQGAEGAR